MYIFSACVQGYVCVCTRVCTYTVRYSSHFINTMKYIRGTGTMFFYVLFDPQYFVE